MEKSNEKMQGAIDSIAESLNKASESLNRLVMLEERHAETRSHVARSFERIESIETAMHAVEKSLPPDLEKRLRGIEQKMPSLVETRGWIIGASGAVVLAVLSLVIKMWFK